MARPKAARRKKPAKSQSSVAPPKPFVLREGKSANPPISIGPAQSTDQVGIEALAAQLFSRARLTFGPDDHYLAASAHFPSQPLNAAQPNGLQVSVKRLVGWAHLRVRRSTVLLQGLAVHPDWRRRGLGERLLSAALAQSAHLRPSWPIVLKVKAANEQALSLYRRAGFMVEKFEGGVYRLRRAPPN